MRGKNELNENEPLSLGVVMNYPLFVSGPSSYSGGSSRLILR
jgi:hypothetical protein